MYKFHKNYCECL